VGENSIPLSMAQKRLVEFMVLNPVHFRTLEEHGIRESLSGSVGEIIFLQLQTMVTEGEDFEAEDLLSKLPEGPERKLVADMLMQASRRGLSEDEGEDAEGKGELGDMLHYLKKIFLQKQSENVKLAMKKAENEGDVEKLQKLLMEMVEIERKLHE
jgi:hypothetical protein